GAGNPVRSWRGRPIYSWAAAGRARHAAASCAIRWSATRTRSSSCCGPASTPATATAQRCRCASSRFFPPMRSTFRPRSRRRMRNSRADEARDDNNGSTMKAGDPMTLRSALAAAGAVSLALATTAQAGSLDELYAKARNEKALVIYAGGPVSNYEPLAREFEGKFPGLTVSIEGGFSNVLNQKIEQQFKDGKLLADMVLLQTAQDFVRWKGEARMLAFKPQSFDAIDRSFKDPDGAFIVWYVGTLSYAYNTQQVKGENAPKSALDFLKPEFRGKMIACYPHDDDATLYLFHTILQKYDDGYLDKYLANQPNWVQGHLSVSRSVAAGKDNVVTLDATTSTILNLKKAGQPIKYAFSNADPFPIYYATA